ncbi:MAG: rhomboid family intramembrane serine protease [Candidatus Eisenbacteria bacterium]|nr:rhomboid family intramembrane serine protease [Candidatus Eisenbacteria bacterium]
MNRDYAGGGVSFGGPLRTVVGLLIAWNVIFFLGQSVAAQALPGLDRFLLYTLGLVPRDVIHGRIWQLLTYMFLHGSFFHIAFNMLALWMFGSQLEFLWGGRRFIQYYLFTGIGAGITNTVFEASSSIPIVGASGAVYGLLLAYGIYFPNRQILVYFLFPMRAKYFVILFGLLEFLASIRGFTIRDGIAHLAHLGGLLFGLIYIKGIPLRWLRRSRRGGRGRGTRVVDIRSHRDFQERDPLD